jgi:molecular chaperone GrpE
MAKKTTTKKDLSAALKEKKREIEELKSKIAEYVDRIKHLQADFDNYKKRVKREEEELRERILDSLLLEIIPIYDNLERAFKSYKGNEDKDSFIEGIRKIFSQFHSFLSYNGLVPIEALGRRFDPRYHEVLLTVESDGEEGIILEEFERGYMRRGRVLRPSKVKVSKKKEV